MQPQPTVPTVKTFTTAQSVGLRVRKMLGRSHLRANRLTDGVDIYASILEDYPDDLEAILILADLYLTAEERNAAGALFRRASVIDPQNEIIQKKLEETHSEAGAADVMPTDPRAIKRLLQKLSGRPEPPSEVEVERAALLMREILSSDTPASTVARHLDEIDALLPALLELNISQAYSDGRPDLAEGLTQLQTNIVLQERALPGAAKERAIRRLPKPFSATVQVLVANSDQVSPRVQMISESVQATGGKVRIMNEIMLSAADRPDVVLAANPHLSARLLETIALYTAARVPVVIDLDTDFEHMPLNHPDYANQGLNTPSRAKALTTAMLLANLITVPSEFYAQALQNSGYPAVVVPDGWSRSNRYYSKQVRVSKKVSLGWIDKFCQFEDLLEIRRIVTRILHEFEDAQIVVVGNLEAFRLFDRLPLNQRVFLPEVSADDMPLLLNQFDLLLLPYRNIPFNLSQSDLPLVLAGAKGLPWVASSVPGVDAWNQGGLVARTPEEWHSHLRHLMLDKELRQTLGTQGRCQALQREVDFMKHVWRTVLENVLEGRAPESMMNIQSLIH